MIIVRYADDFIVGFEHGNAARRFLDAMRVRLREFALSLHPEKTRLIEFGRFAGGEPQAARARQTGDLQAPEASPTSAAKRDEGKFQIKRKSRRDRMRAKLQEVKRELRLRMHQPIPEQGKWLKQVIAGYLNYHAVPTNGRALAAFRYHIVDLWKRTLRRRSQKDRTNRARVGRLANDFLPKPRILHPWPQMRFAVRHPRWEPYALIGPVRFCAGGAQ